MYFTLNPFFIGQLNLRTAVEHVKRNVRRRAVSRIILNGTLGLCAVNGSNPCSGSGARRAAPPESLTNRGQAINEQPRLNHPRRTGRQNRPSGNPLPCCERHGRISPRASPEKPEQTMEEQQSALPRRAA